MAFALKLIEYGMSGDDSGEWAFPSSSSSVVFFALIGSSSLDHLSPQFSSSSQKADFPSSLFLWSFSIFLLSVFQFSRAPCVHEATGVLPSSLENIAYAMDIVGPFQFYFISLCLDNSREALCFHSKISGFQIHSIQKG